VIVSVVKTVVVPYAGLEVQALPVLLAKTAGPTLWVVETPLVTTVGVKAQVKQSEADPE